MILIMFKKKVFLELLMGSAKLSLQGLQNRSIKGIKHFSLPAYKITDPV